MEITTVLATRRASSTGRTELGAETVFGHLLRISRALAGQLDFRSAIRAVSDELESVLPHDHLDVCLLRSEFHVAYEAGIDTGWGLHPLPQPVSGSPIRALLTGTVPFLLSDDAVNDPRFRFDGAFNEPIFTQNLRSRLHVPLIVHGEIIGAFSCSRHDAGFYRAEDVPLAQHVADILAPYLYALRVSDDARRAAIEEAEGRAREEGLREGALRLTEELERERQRIGMDLHDQTLADLTRVTRRLSHLRDAGRAEASDLDGAVDALQRCMGELREIIDDARPNILELFGFAEGMDDFLRRALADSGTGIEGRLIDRSDGALDRVAPALRVALFRIVQEAVNNAANHAEPSRIEVELRCEEGAVAIEIRDDGIGFASIQQRKRVGGIRNMQTRARLVSAQFSITRRSKAGGTLVSLLLPLPAPASAP